MGSNIYIKNLSLQCNFDGRTVKCYSATNNSLHHNIMEQQITKTGKQTLSLGVLWGFFLVKGSSFSIHSGQITILMGT